MPKPSGHMLTALAIAAAIIAVQACPAAFAADAEASPASAPAPRIDLSDLIDAVVADIVKKTPEFKPIDPSRILIVASDARHASRATTRPTRFQGGERASADGKYVKPAVRWRGSKVVYMIELRPSFFRDSTVEGRLKTLVHELKHTCCPFDGAIKAGNSHKTGDRNDFDMKVDAITAAYAGKADRALLKPLAADGEVKFRQWLKRPPFRIKAADRTARREYGAADLFTGPIEVITLDSPLKRALNAR